MGFLSDDELARAAFPDGEPGVGPHPRPWPEDPRLDPDLLAEGDRRNVVDRYRYWRLEAIVADLDARRRPLRIAIQNWAHDFNIGSIVRTANAFNVSRVHIIGRRRWNRRGAMVTDKYLHVDHHPTTDDFLAALKDEDYHPIGVDNLPGSVPLETAKLPERSCLIFGSEGPGLTPELLAAVSSWWRSPSTAPPGRSTPVPQPPSRCTTGACSGAGDQVVGRSGRRAARARRPSSDCSSGRVRIIDCRRLKFARFRPLVGDLISQMINVVHQQFSYCSIVARNLCRGPV